MDEKGSLQWFLIKHFILILLLVGIIERIIMEVLNRWVIPTVQYYYFANTRWNMDLSTWQILLLVLAVLAELGLYAVKGALPSFMSTGIQYRINGIENKTIKLIPALRNNRSVTQMRFQEQIILMMIIVLIIFVIVVPYVIAAMNFSWLVSREVKKINQQEMAIHAGYDKRRNLMLSDIAHDLRTPITTISGYAKALQDGMVEDPKKQAEYLTAIYSKSLRMNELINLLFEYVKLDSEGFSLDKKPIDLIELLKENAALMYSDIEDHGMELDVNIPETRCMVLADKIQISRVITNLFTNAMRHNDEGTHILAGARLGEDKIEIIIADNGKEIPKEVAKHLFEPFAMGDESRNSKGGSGLGLSIAAKIVEMHGWKLVLKEYPGYTKAFVIEINC